MENEKELTLMPYGNHNGIVICCKNCGSEFEETSEGYYPPIKYESDKHNRLCRRCLTELGTFSQPLLTTSIYTEQTAKT